MPSDNAQSVSVLFGGHSSFAALNLNQNYLQSVATLCAGKQIAVILADRDHINNSH
jgi:hypothetical protein